MSDQPPERPQPPDDETGLPGFRTWPAVYIFVGTAFVFYVCLLTALTWHFHG